MSRVCVLIPTYSKTSDEVRDLCVDLGATGPCIVSNQVQEAADVALAPNLRLLNVTGKGVSANRNNLLAHLEHDIGLFIDDDCILRPDYEQIVSHAFFARPDAEAIVFSRDSEDSMFSPVTLKDRRVRRFSDVSSMGAPGIALRKEAVLKYDLRFHEKLGTPNYFFNGEDSVFLMNMLRKGVTTYTSSAPIFRLKNSSGSSSYFQGYDDHFFVSVGGVQYLLHRRLFPAYFLKQAFFYSKKTNVRMKSIIRSFFFGKKVMDDKIRSGEIGLWNEKH